VGVDELEPAKLKILLQLQYGLIMDAVAEPGDPTQINGVFVGFRKYLYQLILVAYIWHPFLISITNSLRVSVLPVLYLTEYC
jgi:hypothetical protein